MKRLTQRDYKWAAETLNCEIAAIKAVISVEAGRGGGFLDSGYPKILFESHWFHELTNGKYDRSHPHLSTKRWTKAHYLGGIEEYSRLNEAVLLNPRSALKSASWGMFQILGVNYSVVGYTDIFVFVKDMFHSERKHLEAFVNFIKSKELEDELQRLDWAGFARVYNGPGYKRNNYDVKMARAYERYKGIEFTLEDGRLIRLTNPYMKGKDIEEIQKILQVSVDGIYGFTTQQAVIEFQDRENLIPDGIVGPNTRKLLIDGI